jgi:hypothetical protein
LAELRAAIRIGYTPKLWRICRIIAKAASLYRPLAM